VVRKHIFYLIGVDGENGLLFEDGDIQQLADHIKAMKLDSNRKKFIENGKVTAHDKYSIENTIQNYESFFQNQIKI
jgi:glycosyltransferase involved in cell wall biosynthesis